MEEYPLHWLIWHNKPTDLDSELSKKVHAIEKLDPRGRSPLMLAVTFGNVEAVKVLLNHNANVNIVNKEGYNVVHEAVSTGDLELVQLVIEKRDYQRFVNRSNGIPNLMNRLKDVSSNVRIDTTLLGFDQNSWQRGNRSYIFQTQGDSVILTEVDHDQHEAYSEKITSLDNPSGNISFLRSSNKIVKNRITSPIAITYVDTEKISFERSKAGIWGWRSDRSEIINNHNCKVFSANSVELVTKQRMEHLSESDKLKTRAPKSPLQSFFGIAEFEEKNNCATNNELELTNNKANPCRISPEEYFDPNVDLKDRDIGRPKEMSTKVQKFKANLWLCESYPLSLPEQIMPIVDLMAISSSHFAKLRDFITLQLPSGFPVKIEIPLFHVLNACITFGNIFSLDEAIQGVTPVKENESAVACFVDDSCFEIPDGYMRIGADDRRQFSVEEDDELLQFAIQQSLMETEHDDDQVTIWEALQSERPHQTAEERQLQRAIEESLAVQGLCTPSSPNLFSSSNHDEFMNISTENLNHPSNIDPQLKFALELSEKENKLVIQRQNEEEKILEEVLRLSLQEK
ncbi:Ankyrin repeat domain-containing protein 13D [Nymphon striatum]|nr:Ankyrin repeat domain-containing protein 13D [Nymphon striatum]